MNYRIYQLKNENMREYGFMPLSFIKKLGREVDQNHYNMVYEGKIDGCKDEFEVLERLFVKFNVERPDDFKGHSMSVSDVVELDGKLFYCDSFGFERII